MNKEDSEEPPSTDKETPLNKVICRGQRVMLAHGGLPEVISPHLIKLIGKTGGKAGPIGRQFIARPLKENVFAKTGDRDPLDEDEYEVAPGLIYKHRGKLTILSIETLIENGTPFKRKALLRIIGVRITTLNSPRNEDPIIIFPLDLD